MKKSLLLIVLFLVSLMIAGCGNTNNVDDRPTLVIGMECGYPPFNWTENIKTETNYPIEGTSMYAEGYDVQMAKIIAEELGRRLVIKAIEWGGLIAALESNQIDAIIAGMSDTEERRASVDFTSPYYRSTHVLVMDKEGNVVKTFENVLIVIDKNNSE